VPQHQQAQARQRQRRWFGDEQKGGLDISELHVAAIVVLKAKGIEFVVAPTVTKTADGNFNSAFVRDPDGILVQLDELVE